MGQLNVEIKKNLQTIDQIVSLVGSTAQWKAQIGQSGGRTFVVKIGNESKQCKYKELMSFVVSQVKAHKDELKPGQIESIINGLKAIDQLGDVKYNESNIYQKFMTLLKRAFGNIGFNKSKMYGKLNTLSSSSSKIGPSDSTKKTEKKEKVKAKEPIKLTCASLFVASTTPEEAKKRVLNILSTMKAEGKLQPKESFKDYLGNEFEEDMDAHEDEALYMSKKNAYIFYQKDSPEVKYFSKSESTLKTLAGRMWIDQVAKENGCDQIKTPADLLFLSSSANLQVTYGQVGTTNPTQMTHMQKFVDKSEDQQFSLEQAKQLATVLVHARYKDFKDPGNILTRDCAQISLPG